MENKFLRTKLSGCSAAKPSTTAAELAAKLNAESQREQVVQDGE